MVNERNVTSARPVLQTIHVLVEICLEFVKISDELLKVFGVVVTPRTV